MYKGVPQNYRRCMDRRIEHTDEAVPCQYTADYAPVPTAGYTLVQGLRATTGTAHRHNVAQSSVAAR